MIERAVESERKSQHMARAFEERVDEMVEARAAEMTVEEAQEINSKPDDSAEKDYNDEEVEEAIETAAEEAAEEAPGFQGFARCFVQPLATHHGGIGLEGFAQYVSKGAINHKRSKPLVFTVEGFVEVEGDGAVLHFFNLMPYPNGPHHRIGLAHQFMVAL